VRRAMNTKNTSRYGSNRFAHSRGGMITITGDINIFMRTKSVPAAPGIVSPDANGVSLLLTFDTGSTLSGTAIFPDWNATHAFEDPAVEATLSYQFTGTVLETWAST
jgi:hypothetical protein